MIAKIYQSLIISSFLIITGCSDSTSKKNECIHFAVSAEYPPFEYIEQGVLKGFDIDIAKAIASNMNKEACFSNMQFSSILPALSTNQVDVAISTLTITAERQKKFDFSKPYYFEGMAAVFKKSKPIKSLNELPHKKIAAQMGSTMEIWLKKYAKNSHILAMNNNNQAIEALKADHVDLVFIDGAQGAVFSKKNQGLEYVIVVQAEDGYGLAFKKGSLLKNKIDKALSNLEQNGEMEKLKNYWFKG